MGVRNLGGTTAHPGNKKVAPGEFLTVIMLRKRSRESKATSPEHALEEVARLLDIKEKLDEENFKRAGGEEIWFKGKLIRLPKKTPSVV